MRGRALTGHRPLGAFFLAAGALHFTHTRHYEAIVPNYLPVPRALVWLSGVAEIIGALAAQHPRTRRGAGLWLAATLVAVFPANVQMARHPDRYRRFPAALLYARLPLQAIFIAWALRATR